MYNCLPMYHSIGGVVGDRRRAGQWRLGRDQGQVLRRPVLDDIVRWDCTLFQYIGELCRYLLHAPAHRRERAHRIRLACGNGLRRTCGTVSRKVRHPAHPGILCSHRGQRHAVQHEGKPGAIGRVPSFLAHRSPTALVKYDVGRGEFLRDADGRCMRCGPHEVGEAIGKIAADRGSRFEGYTDKHETEKKIVRDVFEAGDAWFRTGDLMRKDERGHFYFVDRVGDTFRWKGENVSNLRSVGCDRGLSRDHAGDRLWGGRFRMRGPGRNGGRGSATGRSISSPSAAPGRASAGICRPLFLRVCDDID